MSADLVLGTAQLGSAYGVNNVVGGLTDAQAVDVLDAAADSGVFLLDTAEAYGESEDRIGDFRRAHGDVFRICTKLSGELGESGEDLRFQVRHRIQAASVKLFAPSIFLYYLHSFEMCRNEELLYALEEEREAGSIEHVGISIYEPSELRYVMESTEGIVDAVQVPLNVFNCAQWLEGGLLEEARTRGIMLLARSIYLQGMVFKKPGDAMVRALGLEGTLTHFDELCSELGLSPAEFACSFVALLPDIAYVILGSETPDQVRANAAMLDNLIPLEQEVRRKVIEMSMKTNQDALDPRRWNTLLGSA